MECAIKCLYQQFGLLGLSSWLIYIRIHTDHAWPIVTGATKPKAYGARTRTIYTYEKRPWLHNMYKTSISIQEAVGDGQAIRTSKLVLLFVSTGTEVALWNLNKWMSWQCVCMSVPPIHLAWNCNSGSSCNRYDDIDRDEHAGHDISESYVQCVWVGRIGFILVKRFWSVSVPVPSECRIVNGKILQTKVKLVISSQ